MRKIAVFICLLLVTSGTSLSAQDSTLYSLQEKISVPGNGGYDYLSIDAKNHHLFVSHGTAVNVIDLHTNQVIGTIDDMQEVHGIAVVKDVNKGFITDGKANAVVAFDLQTFKKLKTIPVSGKGPDAITYDPFSKKVFAFCGDSNNSCVIDINSLTETNTIELGGAPEFGVPDGNGLLYNNLEDKSSLDVIDTKTMKVIHTYPLSPCGGPTGLAIDKTHKRVFTVCRENKGMSVVDMNSGKVTATIPIGAGVDAVAYDAATKLLVVSNADGTATIIRQKGADDYEVVQTLATTYRAKTMALDAATHTIYLSAPQFVTGTRNIVPGTFSVYVYKMK
ncbi:MAG: YncE family protein [Bacteroidota bacterium]|nr:YncE family protein [Bacteroidota bacterium]